MILFPNRVLYFSSKSNNFFLFRCYLFPKQVLTFSKSSITFFPNQVLPLFPNQVSSLFGSRFPVVYYFKKIPKSLVYNFNNLLITSQSSPILINFYSLFNFCCKDANHQGKPAVAAGWGRCLHFHHIQAVALLLPRGFSRSQYSDEQSAFAKL